MAKKIIVVDDDQEIVNIIKATLKSKGYTALEAYNGEEGMKLIRQENPDLVIIDLRMPVMSGMEVCKRLRKEPKFKNLPIIVTSAVGKDSGKSEEFWKSGLQCDDFVSKPFDPLDLLGRVEFIFRRNEYVSTKEGAARPPEAAKEGERADLVNATPKQVVKTFIEAWNTQDFASEYNSLAEEMRGNISLKDYMTRRKQFYLDSDGTRHSQKLIKVLETTQSHNAAKVVCVREDTINSLSKQRQETYVLRKTDAGWKIISVRSKPT
jgi:DNA-binding response OmpR family regulator